LVVKKMYDRTIINSIRLSTNPRWTPLFISNSLLASYLNNHLCNIIICREIVKLIVKLIIDSSIFKDRMVVSRPKFLPKSVWGRDIHRKKTVFVFFKVHVLHLPHLHVFVEDIKILIHALVANVRMDSQGLCVKP